MPYSKEYYEANKERIKAESRAYYHANKARSREQGRKYRHKHRARLCAYHRQYYKDNAKRLKADKAKYRKANPELYSLIKRKSAYGITPEQFKNMLKSQGRRCAICLKKFNKPKQTHVDHCHKTGKVRGILCHLCNAALGFFGDSIEVLRSAISYLGLQHVGRK